MTTSILELERNVNRWTMWYRLREMVMGVRGLTLGVMIAYGFTRRSIQSDLFSRSTDSDFDCGCCLGVAVFAAAALIRPHSRMSAARFLISRLD